MAPKPKPKMELWDVSTPKSVTRLPKREVPSKLTGGVPGEKQSSVSAIRYMKKTRAKAASKKKVPPSYRMVKKAIRRKGG